MGKAVKSRLLATKGEGDCIRATWPAESIRIRLNERLDAHRVNTDNIQTGRTRSGRQNKTGRAGQKE